MSSSKKNREKNRVKDLEGQVKELQSKLDVKLESQANAQVCCLGMHNPVFALFDLFTANNGLLLVSEKRRFD